MSKIDIGSNTKIPHHPLTRIDISQFPAEKSHGHLFDIKIKSTDSRLPNLSYRFVFDQPSDSWKISSQSLVCEEYIPSKKVTRRKIYNVEQAISKHPLSIRLTNGFVIPIDRQTIGCCETVSVRHAAMYAQLRQAIIGQRTQWIRPSTVTLIAYGALLSTSESFINTANKWVGLNPHEAVYYFGLLDVANPLIDPFNKSNGVLPNVQFDNSKRLLSAIPSWLMKPTPKPRVRKIFKCSSLTAILDALDDDRIVVGSFKFYFHPRGLNGDVNNTLRRTILVKGKQVPVSHAMAIVGYDLSDPKKPQLALRDFQTVQDPPRNNHPAFPDTRIGLVSGDLVVADAEKIISPFTVLDEVW